MITQLMYPAIMVIGVSLLIWSFYRGQLNRHFGGRDVSTGNSSSDSSSYADSSSSDCSSDGGGCN